MSQVVSVPSDSEGSPRSGRPQSPANATDINDHTANQQQAVGMTTTVDNKAVREELEWLVVGGDDWLESPQPAQGKGKGKGGPPPRGKGMGGKGMGGGKGKGATPVVQKAPFMLDGRDSSEEKVRLPQEIFGTSDLHLGLNSEGMRRESWQRSTR